MADAALRYWPIALLSWFLLDTLAAFAFVRLSFRWKREGRYERVIGLERVWRCLPVVWCRVVELVIGIRLAAGNIASAAAELGRNAEALKWATRARRARHPISRLTGLSTAAAVLLDEGRIDEALALTKAMEPLRSDLPGSALAHVCRAYAFMARGDWSAAREEIDSIDGALAHTDVAGIPRAHYHLARGEFAQALKASGFEQAHLRILDRSEAGREIHTRLTEDTRRVLVCQIAWTGGLRDLLDDLLLTFEHDPVHRPSQAPFVMAIAAARAAEQGNVESARARIGEAGRALARVAGNHRTQVVARCCLAQAFLALGDAAVALREADSAVEHATVPLSRHSAHAVRGLVLEAAGRPAEAVEAYRAALSQRVETWRSDDLRRNVEALSGPQR